MSEKDIEDRLRSHAKAFDSLLGLIPAKLYFSQDNSEQWKKRKQTREESQAAKRAKLDPDQLVTVKEVEDEQKRQREDKRQKQQEDGLLHETKSQLKARKKEEKRRQRRERNTMEVKPADKPTMKTVSGKKDSTTEAFDNTENRHQAKRKDEKTNRVRLKVNGTEKSGKASLKTLENSSDEDGSSKNDSKEVEENDEDTEDDDDNEDRDGEPPKTSGHKSIRKPKTNKTLTNGIKPPVKGSQEEEGSLDSGSEDGDEESIQRINGLSTVEDANNTPSPIPSNNANGSPAQKSLAERLKVSKDPLVQQQLKERLAKRIEELRQARKADGGQIPRNRTELMEQRRKRDELRKERKKQMRLQAKAEAIKPETTQDEAQVSVNGGSRSKTNGASNIPTNYSFGQINFDDGDKATASLDGIKSSKKRRGPTDVLGAIKHVEAKKARLANMPEDKRADIQEKDRWSKALKMASGEKLQDDETLLKKSLKRQEKSKKKSEKEWKERNSNVEKSKAMRQKKRDANIAARKEQKKSGKSGKKARKVPSKKSKGRAGFEGTGFGGAGKKKAKA